MCSCSGIMKYVGEAFAEIEEAGSYLGRKIPLIGITTFDKLALKSEFAKGITPSLRALVRLLTHGCLSQAATLSTTP